VSDGEGGSLAVEVLLIAAIKIAVDAPIVRKMVWHALTTRSVE